MAVTNPNGSNQYVKDPRQKLCWELYVDPDSDTFSNGMQSAIKAGYEEGTANQITTFEWFKENLRTLNILSKAERNLENLLDNEDDKIRADMTKFTLETLGKKKFSKRKELTGAEGKDLMPTPILATVAPKVNEDNSPTG